MRGDPAIAFATRAVMLGASAGTKRTSLTERLVAPNRDATGHPSGLAMRHGGSVTEEGAARWRMEIVMTREKLVIPSPSRAFELAAAGYMSAVDEIGTCRGGWRTRNETA
jgi:hypothetical protein